MAQRNRNSRRRDSAPGWVWMLFGLGVGLIIAIGVYLRMPVPAATPAASAASAPPARPEPPAERARPQPRPAASASDESRFEFYEILPQFEVVVPGEDDSRPTTASRPRPAETPGSFLLQAGSFSAPADADRLQANLALLGIESHVQRVTIDNAAFNRVRIGPIGDLDAAKRTQRRLRDAGIDTLLMQVPK